MRIFYAFLTVLIAAIMWLLPISTLVYDFRTDQRQDDFTVVTALGVTSANMTLVKAVYDDDTATIGIVSQDATDTPIYSSYNVTSRQLAVTGLSANLTRVLNVTYDVDALNGSDSLDTVANIIPFIWLLLIIVLPIAGLAAIFTGRA